MVHVRHPRSILTIALVASLALASRLSAQPYSIGYRDVDLTSVAFRPMRARLFYPATIPGDGAPFAATSIPFPLVAFAGQPGIDAGAYRYLVDHLVVRGYIVAMLTDDTVASDRGNTLGRLPEALVRATRDTLSPLLGAPIGTRSAIGGHGAGGTAAVFAQRVGSRGGLPQFTIGASVSADPRVLDVAATEVRGAVLTISGSNDCIAPDSTNALRLHQAYRSDCRTRALIVGASHCYFAGHDVNCQISEAECTVSPTIAREEQHRVVDSLLLPWLDWQLRDRCEGLERFAAFRDSSSAIVAADGCADPLVGFSLAPDDIVGLCPGDSVLLSAPEGYASYLWDDGVTTRSRFVATPGAHRVTARGGGDCSIRSAWTDVSYSMDPPAQSSSIIRLCPGRSARLFSSSNAPRHRWSTGDTTLILTVTRSGRYWVTYSNDSCTATSDTTTVIVDAAPRVIVDGRLAGCLGDTAVLSAPSHLRNLRWMNGSTARTIAVTEQGSWWYSAIDTSDCSVVSDTVDVTRLRPIVPVISLTGYTLRSTPAAAYQWIMDEVDIPGATGRTYVVTRNAYYAVRTIDSNGCVARSTVRSVTVSGVVETERGTPRVVVRDGALEIVGVDERYESLRASLVDLLGAVVRDLFGAGPHPLDGLSSGAYHVIITSSDGPVATHRLVLVR